MPVSSRGNSETRLVNELLLDDLHKIRSDEIEGRLERGRSLDLNRTVVTALGGWPGN